MAQVTSGRVASGKLKNSYFYVNWQQASQSTSKNETIINWQAGLNTGGATSNYDYWYSNAVKINSVYINGVNVCSGTYSNIGMDKGKDYQLASGSVTIPHNTDGTKTISISISGWLYTYGDTSGSNNFELVKIPRYLTINSFNITNITETSVIVNWTVSDLRSGTYYSLDNGATWIGSATHGESLGSDGKSGSFNINGLNAGTNYNLKIRIKRSDSGLWTESENKSFSTYYYPHCIDSPNFTIGNALTLSFYNPLNRWLDVRVVGAGETTIGRWYGYGTSISGFNDSDSINLQYNTIPNSTFGYYKVLVTYDNHTEIRDLGNTYSIRGNEVPTINAFDYIDSNNSTVSITGNNKHIIQNKSILQAQFHRATANYGAGGIAKYIIEVNGYRTERTAEGSYDLGTVNSSRDVALNLTAVDTRGLSATKSINVTMLEHGNPSAIVTLERLNNYEDESYLTVDGSISSVNGKNTMTIQYRYKVSGGTYNSFTTIGDREKQTLSLNKENNYIFNIVITDILGATYDKEHILGKGTFPLFIDTKKNSVGINCLPIHEKSLEINKDIYVGDIKCKNLLYTPYTENYKLTLTATKDDHFVTTDYYCYLEAGKKYTFSCETDAPFGGANGTDTVQVFLAKDRAYDLYYNLDRNPYTFTVSQTGNYFLRYDVNKSGATHSFWNFQIEEGETATEFVEAKEFSNKQHYWLEAQHIGTWIDGMPLYRKVIKTTNVTVSYAGLNVYNIIDVKIIANINNVVLFNTGRYNNSQDMFTWYVNVETGTINIDVGSAWDLKEATIILVYTKY